MIRLDRLQIALRQALVDGLPTGTVVYWAPPTPVEHQLPDVVIALSMVAGPGSHLQHSSGVTQPVLRSVLCTLLPLVVGNRVGVRLNGYDYTTDVVAGDTHTTVRTRLLDLLNADPEPVTAAAGILDSDFTLTSEVFGAIATLFSTGPLTAPTYVDYTERGSATTVTRRVLVSLSVLTRNPEPWRGAQHFGSLCHDVLWAAPAQTLLRRYGFGLGNLSAPSSIPLLESTTWQGRTSLDCLLFSRSTSIVPVDHITSASPTFGSV